MAVCFSEYPKKKKELMSHSVQISQANPKDTVSRSIVAALHFLCRVVGHVAASYKQTSSTRDLIEYVDL